MRCAEACFNNKDCNFFTFNAQSSICSLKNVSDIISTISKKVNSQGSICGLIEKRIPINNSSTSSLSLYGRSWYKSIDGSYAFSFRCSLSNYYTISADTGYQSATEELCAQQCKARLDVCTHFSFDLDRRGCQFYKATGPLIRVNDESGYVNTGGWGCGILTQSILSTEFNNVEFMTNYSNSEKQEFITTSTVATTTTTTTAPAASQDYFDIDFIEW